MARCRFGRTSGFEPAVDGAGAIVGSAAGAPGEAPRGDAAVPGAARRLHRPAQLPRPRVAARTARRRRRSDPPALRSASHLRHLRASRRDLDLRPLPVHGRELGDDRPPLRPPRPRRPRTCRRAPRHLRARLRRVDATWTSQQSEKTRSATALRPSLTRRRSERWTFRGRRRSETSPTPLTKARSTPSSYRGPGLGRAGKCRASRPRKAPQAERIRRRDVARTWTSVVELLFTLFARSVRASPLL